MRRGAVARRLWEACVRVCGVDGGRPIWLHTAGSPPRHCCRCCTFVSHPQWMFLVNTLS